MEGCSCFALSSIITATNVTITIVITTIHAAITFNTSRACHSASSVKVARIVASANVGHVCMVCRVCMVSMAAAEKFSRTFLLYRRCRRQEWQQGIFVIIITITIIIAIIINNNDRVIKTIIKSDAMGVAATTTTGIITTNPLLMIACDCTCVPMQCLLHTLLCLPIDSVVEVGLHFW